MNTGNWYSRTKLKELNYLKKGGIALNFCFIGKIWHNFLVPKVIEAEQFFSAYSDISNAHSEQNLVMVHLNF